jgi:hypothetical protein
MKSMIVGGAAAVSLLAGSAAAAPVLWSSADGGNDHYYDVITWSEGNVSWDDALADAASKSYMDLDGYLATVTSEAENNFLVQLFTSVAWIAGSDAGSEGVFTWRAGPEAGAAFTFTSWNSGEPNNCCGGENYVQTNWSAAGRWNDAPAGAIGVTATPYYFIEYGGLSTGGGIPEPGTWALMILGFGGAGATLRRRRTAAV